MTHTLLPQDVAACFAPSTGLMLLTGLLLTTAAGLAVPAQAQKIQNETVAAVFHKTPLLTLNPTYKTYSVEYDLGNMVMNVNDRPSLQGLTYQKADGDLLLRLTTKNVYVGERHLYESKTNNRYSAYYTVGYGADSGYELRDVKADQRLARYEQKGGSATTQSFGSLRDLNGYLDNAFVGEQARWLLNNSTRRADFALNPHDYQVDLTLNTIEGNAPAYAAINQATTALKELLVSSGPLDRPKVKAAVAPWQAELARVNWDDKKSDINKKVAGALLENLCAAMLLMEDYAKLGEYAALYSAHNKGLLNGPASFKVDLSYSGTAYSGGTSTFMGRNLNTRQTARFEDVVSDVQPQSQH